MIKLGLLIPNATPSLFVLLRAVARRMQVVDGAAQDCTGYVWWNDTALAPQGAPLAVILADDHDLDACIKMSPTCAVVLREAQEVRERKLVQRAEDLGVPVIVESLGRWYEGPAVPMAPFTRASVRRARGLADRAIVELGVNGNRWNGIDTNSSVETLCGLASAVVTSEPSAALVAIAWGAAVVTDPLTADALGLQDGAETLVASADAARRELAAQLASDDSLAAALGWRARELFERSYDVNRAAQRLTSTLVPSAGGPLSLPERHLDALGTPRTAVVRERVAAALMRLDPSGGISS
jgi:hypothetical protein